jgi:hypothetical protein
MATLTGGLGSQILVGTNHEANDLIGDPRTLGSGQTGGNDTLLGGADSNPNNLFGDALDMGGGALGGDDVLIGGDNSINNLYGDADMMADATGGNDTLIGGRGGTNVLVGDARVGAAGPGSVGGDDRLISADHTTDDMWGDFQQGPGTKGGHDTYVFGPHNGDDIVHDFSHAQGDLIEIAIKHLETFADLNIQRVDANGDNITDSVIHFDAHDSVTVLSVGTFIPLAADDFLFVI